MKRYLSVVLLLTFANGAGCNRPPDKLTDAEKILLDQGIRVMVEGVAEDLGRRGPIAWLDHFADVPGFFMASDGTIVFEDMEAARSFLVDFAPRIDDMNLTWRHIRVDPLNDSMAVMSASYDESLTDTSGTVMEFGGLVSGLVVDTPEGWRFQNLHWSSPQQSSENGIEDQP